MTGIADGQREGWQASRIVLSLTVGTAAAIGFVLWELRVDKPLLEIRMFAIPAFAASAVVAFIFGAGMMGSTYLVPVFVQTTQGFSPLEAGLMMMPGGLMLAVIFPLAGRLADAVSPALMIMCGLLVYALGLVMMSTADADTTFWTLAGVTMISRLGLGFINPSLNASSLKALPPELVRQGAGASNFLRQLGGAFGINLGVVFLELRTRFHAEALTATQDYANSTTRRLISQVEHLLARSGLPETIQKSGALEYLGSIVQGQSLSLAFQDTFILGAIVALAAVPPGLPAVALAAPPERRRAAGGGADLTTGAENQ